MRTTFQRWIIGSMLLVFALAVLPGCQSGPPGRSMAERFDGGGDWTRGKTERHPALLPQYQIQWWTRGTGPARQKVGSIAPKEGGDGVRASDLQELVPFCHPLESPPSARRFGHLARLLHTPGLPIDGTPVDPDPTIVGMGGNGRYSLTDAEAWGIEFDPPGIPTGGGFEMQRVLLVAPWTHPDLKYKSPYKLIWARGIVYPDGSVTLLEKKTLTNGDDAQRFIKF